jgi:hypothetical protein
MSVKRMSITFIVSFAFRDNDRFLCEKLKKGQTKTQEFWDNLYTAKNLLAVSAVA